MQFLGKQVSLVYEIPMNEVVLDFFDRLKSCSKGSASLDYQFERFDTAKLVRLDILINSAVSYTHLRAHETLRYIV